MKCWLITVGEPLPVVDPGNPRLLRTGALARLLTERGHTVHWWTSTFDHYRKVQRAKGDRSFEWEGGTVRMLHSVGYRRNVSPRRFMEHAGVARKFAAQASGLERPDVILASLPTIELAREAVRYGQQHGVPVLLDIRDLWPDLLIDVAPPPLRWMSRWLLRGLVKDARWAMSGADGLVGISEGYLAWGLRYAGRGRRQADAMIPLGYVAPAATRTDAQTGLHMRELGINSDSALCWYVGSFGRQYDLEPVLRAARALQAAGRSDVQFVISGDGERGARWHDLARGLTNVVFTGWIGADEINWLRANAAIGLQPYVAGAPQGLANKLFEYLSAGLPVVSSLSGENETLIASHNCGLTYRAGDAADCARCLCQLLDDPLLRRRMGANGKRLFDQQYDGRAVFETLVEHLETVERSGARKSNP